MINGTGILVHTNLRPGPARRRRHRALSAIGSNYNNLEYGLTGGARGGRAAYLEHGLALLCGAEAATVVNNNAAALVLILRHFCAGGRRARSSSRAASWCRLAADSGSRRSSSRAARGCARSARRTRRRSTTTRGPSRARRR